MLNCIGIVSEFKGGFTLNNLMIIFFAEAEPKIWKQSLHFVTARRRRKFFLKTMPPGLRPLTPHSPAAEKKKRQTVTPWKFGQEGHDLFLFFGPRHPQGQHKFFVFFTKQCPLPHTLPQQKKKIDTTVPSAAHPAATEKKIDTTVPSAAHPAAAEKKIDKTVACASKSQLQQKKK